MTDDETKAHIGQAKAEAESMTLREANRARNQAVGIFGFALILFAIVGYFGLDAIVAQRVTDAIADDVITLAREAAVTAGDEAVVAAAAAKNAAASAEALALLPVGSILARWDCESTLPTGWAICDGDYPELGWPNRTPDLEGRVMVGASEHADTEVKTAASISIPEPARKLGMGSQPGKNQVLIANGWAAERPDSGEECLERVKTVLPAGDDHVITISSDNLPRAQVHFIIRYK